MSIIPTTFAAILGAIRDLLFSRMANGGVRTPMLIFVSNYLGRTAERFQRLYTHWRNATLPAPRAPRPARPTAPPAAQPPSPPPLRLPRRRAWVLHHDRRVTAFISQLRHLLDQPDCAEFLRAVPRAARLIRPVLHLICPNPPPPLLALPPRPALMRPGPLRSALPRPLRHRRPPPPPLFPPIQPYVLAAARAWRKNPA